MDKNALKDFAMKSRESLTRMMRAKLESFHIEDELIFKQHGDIWENEQHRLQAMTNSEYERYKSLKYAVKRDGLKLVIERAAYIWFNRIVAIRYMEVNNILPLGKNHESLDINVLCDKSGDFRNPEILTISKLRSTDLKVDYNRINSLNNQDKYKEILLEVVKKIGEAIPDVFSGDTENIDALIPDGLLMPNGLIDNILKLGTDQFKHTEIIGWLYQYYNQAEKDRAMKLKTPTAKDDIPYVTQIFTPDWVVKYLVENSLGRYWLDRHPNEELEAKWKYLVKKKEKTEVIRDGRRIEDITFIDPCSGSGHILIYAFEVFYQIYESEGYPKSDIPQLILNNNLYGLDIDDRANQLSILACTLVARKYDDKLFSKNIKQHILSIRESNKINLSAFDPKGEARDVLDYLLNSFYDAKEYGSILKIKNMNYDSLRKAIKDDQIAINLKLDKDLEPLIAQAEILSKKFTIAITNPPYMNKYNAKLKSYISGHYPDEKSDLAIVFMSQCLDLTEASGIVSLVNIESWMFLRTTLDFRKNILEKYSISDMIHLGNGAFSDVVVATTAFVINKRSGMNGTFIRATNGSIEEKEFIVSKAVADLSSINRYTVNSLTFMPLPRSILAYWISESLREVLIKSPALQPEFGEVKQGLSTADNDRFLRLWWEISKENIGFEMKNCSEAALSKKKWFPHNKGGQYRKWYGNDDYVINWERDGYEIKNYKRAAVRNSEFFFKPAISWSLVSSGDIAFRYKPYGSIFNAAGSCIFGDQDKLTYLQGLLNTKALLEVSRVVSNSLNNNVGEIANYPIIKSNDNKNEVIELVNECRNLSKDDWDDYETSWNFETHPLFAHKTETNRLSDAFSVYNKHCEERFARLKSNEERLNKIAIDLYNLNEEMAPDISDDRITVRKANREREARSFLSFFIGCVMGRYDYTKNGVQYAGVGTDMPKNNIVDDDGIITILDKEFFGRDDVINKLRKFLSESFGEKTLSENLDWIAGGLGRKDTERSEDVIRKYFVEEFFNNHAHMVYADPTKRSDGRPIYWEISSGKHNAFKTLFYIHRYTPDLIAKVRMDYLIPVLQIYERRRAEIEIQLKTTIGTVEYNRLNNELADLQNKIEELTKFDQVLKNVADQKIELDLDDGVKANYPKLSLAANEVKKNAQILEAIK